VLLLVLASLQLTPVADAGSTANDTIRSFSLSGSPFAPDFAPLPTSVSGTFVLGRRAYVSVRVFKDGGPQVRVVRARKRLAAGTYGFVWDGRNGTGSMLPDGMYEIRVKAENGLGTTVSKQAVRKGLPAIYPANPASIVVVVDPGHGGQYTGACYKNRCERFYNLRIALALQDLLERAGVTVVMTRTTDSAVNAAGLDLNGDGLLNGYDDLTARNDIANGARGDLNIHIHNNGIACHCERGTEVYTNFAQPWTDENSELATHLWREQLAALAQFSDATYYPIDRGIKPGKYYYMAPYSIVCPIAKGDPPACDPPYLPRPTMTPSVLTESFFMQDDIEFALLNRPDVRVALAASFYLGIASWLNSRDLGVGYELISGPPSPVTQGSSLSYRVKVTNRGNVASDGWTLQLHNVSKVPEYDGSGQLGSSMGSVAVPDGLGPGASVELVVDATAPSAAGTWLVKADVQLGDSSYASAHGVVVLQAALTTTAP
jgi:N-acetylmuramoyl-L-alanine amidase